MYYRVDGEVIAAGAKVSGEGMGGAEFRARCAREREAHVNGRRQCGELGLAPALGRPVQVCHQVASLHAKRRVHSKEEAGLREMVAGQDGGVHSR